jgi:hypothetical protein
MSKSCCRVFLLLVAINLTLGVTAFAVPPVVKTVPWVASNPLIPHDTWSGKSIRLKGTCDMQGANIQYTWDFGDGTPVATGTVTNMYAIEASHAYTGPVGTVYTARLTVQNTSTGETANSPYYVAIRTQMLDTEVNVAIDEGLWWLHKNMTRTTSGSSPIGYWVSGNVGIGWYGNDAANVHAFLVNGHSEGGNANNPYTETVSRGMNRIFQYLYASTIPSSRTNPRGTYNPDTNANGYGVFVNQSYPFYQGGMFIDAIIAAGTPNKVTTTGTAPSGANPGILGRTYKDIVQDMVDGYNYCQYNGSPGGGWRYNCGDFPDNSACQWAAIGILPAERFLGIPIPGPVETSNEDWTLYSQAANGSFGYTSTGGVWGPYAVTPSGMVQLAWTGIGRGSPRWDNAETFMRNNFGNSGGATVAPKDYYYGLFSFTKAMQLHDSNDDGVAEPLHMLQSSTVGINPIDWYAAEVSKGDPTNGVARELVGDQNASGYWFGHNYDGNQFYFETAWAIIMLNRTLFAAGAPVAVAVATPNPAVAGQMITLDGSGSFHQDPTKSIVMWQWDIGNDGTFDATGPTAMTSYPVVGNYPVRLRVTDNASTPATADTILTVVVSIPPLAPTAHAGGPYNFCTNRTPWFLDGSLSTNPDNGQSEPGQPGDFIKSYLWDLDGDGMFDDASGVSPNVTSAFSVGSHLIQLKVTDNTATSFPSSGMGDLSDTASSQVTVRSGTDPACTCSTLTAYPKNGLVQLSWSLLAGGADHYNVYRGTISGGPYLKIGTGAGTQTLFFDRTVTNGVTYYYVLRPAALNNAETCQSNQVAAMPRSLR